MSEITNETPGEGTSTNDVNDNYGSSRSELYGTFTWKIKKFSQINEREIYSNAFEIGGHRWYLLIYPRGCDVTYHHLSLFLGVAKYDKLLPGWSHLAQFTVAMENEYPTKSKFSDTIHQFWKKEHDWGWKKFIELSKLYDGFIDKFDDLVIKVQVQVIRECVNRPFPCLDGQYRKELVRVYIKNVEKTFLIFVEEKRSKFVKLIDEKKRWKSLCAFWLGMKQNSRLEMSREKMDVILKLVTNHFFIKNEVPSTLVMDFLFYGLKSLEEKIRICEKLSKLVVTESAMKTFEDKTKNEGTSDVKKVPAPVVIMDKDMFVVKDPMLLLERLVLEPLPEMGFPNLVKLGNVERDEKQLADFGRWVLEVFVLDHIFCNKIEFAYEETIALERQQDLIHEEERKTSSLSKKNNKKRREKKNLK